MTETVLDLIGRGVDGDLALEATGRPPLRYGALRDHVDRTRSALAACGIEGADRVAIVFPPGAELATAFLGVSSAAVAAPLNPAYRRVEFDRLLGQLGARAVLAPAAAGEAIHEAAAAAGIPVLRVTSDDSAPAGVFDVDVPRTTSSPPAPGPDDAALVLHTSGTTSRPKIVPLTHANLAAGAGNVARALGLGAG